MNERLRQIRKDQKKTQEEFAILLGTTRPAITSYERGKVKPTDTFIQLLCTKFNVNEQWLRTGDGDMYVDTNESLIERLALEYKMNDTAKRIITAFCRMDEIKRNTIAQIFFSFINSLEQSPKDTSLENSTDASIDDPELKHRQEIIAKEYAAEKKAEMSSASIFTNGDKKNA